MIDIYLDGADLDAMKEGRSNPLVKGFTTNPSICKAAGVTDYKSFILDALHAANGLPISFEVFSDEWDEMEKQARMIAKLGKNVNVKIPVTNTKGESAVPLIKRLSDSGIICNVTAVFTRHQVKEISKVMNLGIISVFAGRIADTGLDPSFLVGGIVDMTSSNIKILWASPREVLNIYQAEKCGCQIITVTPDLLKKYWDNKNKDLNQFSLETVQMFYNDAKKAGYTL